MLEQPPGRDGDGLGPDDDGRRVAQEPAAEPLAEPRRGPALVGARQLPRREVEERDDQRQPGDERDRPADRVVDGARRRRPDRPATPRRATLRRAGTGRRSGRRSGAAASAAAAAGRRSTRCSNRSVGSSRSEPSSSANDSPATRLGVERAEQAREVARGQRRPIRLLERAGVEDDPDAGTRDSRAMRIGRPERRVECGGHRPSPAPGASSAAGQRDVTVGATPRADRPAASGHRRSVAGRARQLARGAPRHGASRRRRAPRRRSAGSSSTGRPADRGT